MSVSTLKVRWTVFKLVAEDSDLLISAFRLSHGRYITDPRSIHTRSLYITIAITLIDPGTRYRSSTSAVHSDTYSFWRKDEQEVATELGGKDIIHDALPAPCNISPRSHLARSPPAQVGLTQPVESKT